MAIFFHATCGSGTEYTDIIKCPKQRRTAQRVIPVQAGIQTPAGKVLAPGFRRGNESYFGHPFVWHCNEPV